MVRSLEIGLIFLYVSDLKRSREFYVEKLGFQLEYEGKDFVRIRPGNGPPVMLHSAGGRTLTSAGFELELKVDDVDEWYARLRKEGVKFVRPPSQIAHEGDPSGPRRETTLRDPDEYRLALFTPLKKQACRMPDIDVRPMRSDDITERLEQIMDLAIIANPWAERERYKEYEVSLFRQHLELAFVAAKAEQIVGYVMGDSKGEEGEVEELAVLPRCSGKGLGRRLLDAELSALKNAGARSVVVWVGWRNAAAIPFYYKLGFRVFNTVLDRAGPGEDAVYLKRAL